MVEMFFCYCGSTKCCTVLAWHILCYLNTYNVKIEMALNKNWILRFIYIFDVYILQCMKKFNVIHGKIEAFNEGTLLYLCMCMKPLISSLMLLGFA